MTEYVVEKFASRDRRAIVAGLAIIAFVFVARYVVYGAITAHASASNEMLHYQIEARIIREWQAAAMVPSAGVQIGGLEQSLFRAMDPALVTAEMEAHVIEIARTTTVQLTKVTAVAEADRVEDIKGREFSVSGTGDLQQVLIFLNRLETGHRYCRISELSLKSGPGADEDGVEFTFKVVVFGVW